MTPRVIGGGETRLMVLVAAGIRLDTNLVDYAILAIYFVAVLGIGFAAKRYIKTSLDYFLSGRSLPAWITGLAFISANLGALEVLGMAANGAQYGVYTVHYYWIGAVPGHGLPRHRDDAVLLRLEGARRCPSTCACASTSPTHLFNAMTFALATVLIAGVNLYALALVLKLMLGWPILLGIVVAAVVVLIYITLGGLSSAIYNEVLQFFVILAALIPLTIVGLHDVGGWDGLKDKVAKVNTKDEPVPRVAGHRHRPRRQPARRVVGPDRLRPRLRALVRLLDDELRRGPARAVAPRA